MGSTYPAVKQRLGDFDDWIGARVPARYRDKLRTWEPSSHLPQLRSISGIVISGSHAMVEQTNPDSNPAYAWVRDAVELGVPVLGLCFGHQMLAHIMGGKVGNLSRGPEIGFADLEFSNHWDDPLFSVYGLQHQAFTTHYQTIAELPKGATVLGSSTRDGNQAVRFAPKAWGVQYHPEFSREVSVEYVRRQRQVIRDLGQDDLALERHCMQSRLPDPLLVRFVQLALA